MMEERGWWIVDGVYKLTKHPQACPPIISLKESNLKCTAQRYAGLPLVMQSKVS